MSALRVADFPATALAEHADTVAALVGERLDMALVRGALPAPCIERAMAAFNATPEALVGSEIYPDAAPLSMVRVLGTMIAPTALQPRGPELPAYLQAARAFEAQCVTLFGEAPSFAERVSALLSGLFAGRPACVPVLQGQGGYTPATLRVMPPGGGAPVHRDNNPMGPAYAHLRELCDLQPQLSYYIPVSVAEAGGELRVGQPDLAQGATHFTPGPGDMVLFPGSRLEHDVAPVLAGTRRTIGGFCALTRDHLELRFWS